MSVELTIPLRDTLAETLQAFGELGAVTMAALRRYAIDRCLQRIEQAQQQICAYEARYGSDYVTFNERICTKEIFLQEINRNYPTWEADAIEWRYRIDEAEEWRKRLESILREL